MINTEQELQVTKKRAQEYRIGRDELLQKRILEGTDPILEATIGSIEGQILRLYEEIREYEARVLSR